MSSPDAKRVESEPHLRLTGLRASAIPASTNTWRMKMTASNNQSFATRQASSFRLVKHNLVATSVINASGATTST
jgi:hypothetical protein